MTFKVVDVYFITLNRTSIDQLYSISIYVFISTSLNYSYLIITD